MDKWVINLRQNLKEDGHIGFSVTQKSGKVELTHRINEGKGSKNPRSSVTVPIEWKKDNKRKIQDTVGNIHDLMAERKLSLRDAFELYKKQDDIGKNPTDVEWNWLADEYLKTKSDRRTTTLRDTTSRIKKMVEAKESLPKPRDSKELYKRYSERNFEKMPAGGQGRKRAFGDIAAFLKWAVNRQGLDMKWLPPDSEIVQELIGLKKFSEQIEATPPVKPEQFSWLLDKLEEKNLYELRLACGLIGYFGLRLAELAVLQVDGNELYVGSKVKQNLRSRENRKPRLAIGLDCKGRNKGEAYNFLKDFATGAVKLPYAVQSQIDMINRGNKDHYQDVGAAFAQLLERTDCWQELKKAEPDLTPYSLRHGWAFRSHTDSTNHLSVRSAAAAMGHTSQTHQRHYGQWIDQESLKQERDRFNKGVEVKV